MEKIYYRLCDRDLGEEVIMLPQTTFENHNYPVICVAESFVHCAISIPIDYMKDYYLYRTKEKVSSSPTQNVLDSYITKERWL